MTTTKRKVTVLTARSDKADRSKAMGRNAKKAKNDPEFAKELAIKRKRASLKRSVAAKGGDPKDVDDLPDDEVVTSQDVLKLRWKVTLDSIKKAQESGDLPHEFLLKVMKGDPIPHPCRDIETDEIVTMLMIPNMDMRIEAAKAAAPFYAAKQSPQKIAGGGNKDPSKTPGVMEVPVAKSMQEWAEVAASSQSKLKKDVTK